MKKQSGSNFEPPIQEITSGPIKMLKFVNGLELQIFLGSFDHADYFRKCSRQLRTKGFTGKILGQSCFESVGGVSRDVS